MKKDYSQFWMAICILICFIWWASTLDRFKTSPRNKHGIDIVKYNDTIYYTHFKIDSAVYIDPNPDGEPVPDPRR